MLGMGYAVLAEKSGVSLPTVVRTLSANNPNASFANVGAIAEALGMRLNLEQEVGVADLREQQAMRKARRISKMVQATSGLESQALDPGDVDEMTRQTAHELLAGSPRKLWSD
jgi:hypothetical protein